MKKRKTKRTGPKPREGGPEYPKMLTTPATSDMIEFIALVSKAEGFPSGAAWTRSKLFYDGWQIRLGELRAAWAKK